VGGAIAGRLSVPIPCGGPFTAGNEETLIQLLMRDRGSNPPNHAMKTGTEVAIDWDEDKREVNLTDPYLRFFLRWQVRSRQQLNKPLFAL
jgi:hypothetical protein